MDLILDCFRWLHYLTTFCCTQQSVYVICSGDGWFFSPYRGGSHIWKQSTIIVFAVRGTQHIILGLLWYSVGIPVVLKGDLLWWSFCRASAFSVPSWIIYLVGSKMLNTINFSYGLSNGCVSQWIMHCPYTSKVSGSTPAGWDSSFFLSHFVLFCFVS